MSEINRDALAAGIYIHNVDPKAPLLFKEAAVHAYNAADVFIEYAAAQNKTIPGSKLKELQDNLDRWVELDKKIQGIKEIRIATGLGLAQAKAAYEKYAESKDWRVIQEIMQGASDMVKAVNEVS